jgi:hypothetical protein
MSKQTACRVRCKSALKENPVRLLPSWPIPLSLYFHRFNTIHPRTVCPGRIELLAKGERKREQYRGGFGSANQKWAIIIPRLLAMATDFVDYHEEFECRGIVGEYLWSLGRSNQTSCGTTALWARSRPKSSAGQSSTSLINNFTKLLQHQKNSREKFWREYESQPSRPN